MIEIYFLQLYDLYLIKEPKWAKQIIKITALFFLLYDQSSLPFIPKLEMY